MGSVILNGTQRNEESLWTNRYFVPYDDKVLLS